MRVSSRFPVPAMTDEEVAANEAASRAAAAGLVDIDLRGEPAPATAAITSKIAAGSAAPRALRGRRAGLGAAAACATAALTLAGCALWPGARHAEPGADARGYRVTPLYKVDDTPLSAEAYLAAARYYEGSRDWTRAAQAYGKAASRDAASETAWDGLGRTLAAAGRLDEAESALRRAVDLAPEQARAHNNLGYVLLLKDQPAPALAAFDEALRLDAGHARARDNRLEAMTRLAALELTREVAVTSAPAVATAAASEVPVQLVSAEAPNSPSTPSTANAPGTPNAAGVPAANPPAPSAGCGR